MMRNKYVRGNEYEVLWSAKELFVQLSELR